MENKALKLLLFLNILFNWSIMLLFIIVFAIISIWNDIYKNINGDFKDHKEYNNIPIYIITQMALLPLLIPFLFNKKEVFISVLVFTIKIFFNSILTSFMIILLNSISWTIPKPVTFGWLLATSLIYALGITFKYSNWAIVVYSMVLLLLVNCLIKTYLLKKLPYKAKNIINIEAEHINASFKQSNNMVLSMYIFYIYLIIIVVYNIN